MFTTALLTQKAFSYFLISLLCFVVYYRRKIILSVCKLFFRGKLQFLDELVHNFSELNLFHWTGRKQFWQPYPNVFAQNVTVFSTKSEKKRTFTLPDKKTVIKFSLKTFNAVLLIQLKHFLPRFGKSLIQSPINLQNNLIFFLQIFFWTRKMQFWHLA